jgi:hypothetical protein
LTSKKGLLKSSKLFLLSSTPLNISSFKYFIKTPVMLYYSRIQSDGINPLAKETFNINKNISNENSYTWYTLCFLDT